MSKAFSQMIIAEIVKVLIEILLSLLNKIKIKYKIKRKTAFKKNELNRLNLLKFITLKSTSNRSKSIRFHNVYVYIFTQVVTF